MKKIFYEKIGKRYYPVSEYDSAFQDAYPKGAHLIMSRPGHTSCKYNIDPDYAALTAAAIVAQDALSEALVKAGELRLAVSQKKKPLTIKQKKAWENLIHEFGQEARQLEWPSAREVSQAGIDCLQQELKILLSNEAVKKAYDHFVLMCKLTKEKDAT